jgi:hypothetical protein
VRLYVDDVRRPPIGWALARSLNEAHAFLLEHRDDLEMVSLDYDLGEGQPSGFEVLLMMEREGIWPSHLSFHSSDLGCRERMTEFVRRVHPPLRTLNGLRKWE